MNEELMAVSATLVGDTRVEIRERRAGIDDAVINIPLSFVPTIVKQLNELLARNEEQLA